MDYTALCNKLAKVIIYQNISNFKNFHFGKHKFFHALMVYESSLEGVHHNFSLLKRAFIAIIEAAKFFLRKKTRSEVK